MWFWYSNIWKTLRMKKREKKTNAKWFENPTNERLHVTSMAGERIHPIALAPPLAFFVGLFLLFSIKLFRLPLVLLQHARRFCIIKKGGTSLHRILSWTRFDNVLPHILDTFMYICGANLFSYQLPLCCFDFGFRFSHYTRIAIVFFRSVTFGSLASSHLSTHSLVLSRLRSHPLSLFCALSRFHSHNIFHLFCPFFLAKWSTIKQFKFICAGDQSFVSRFLWLISFYLRLHCFFFFSLFRRLYSKCECCISVSALENFNRHDTPWFQSSTLNMKWTL